MTDCCLPAAPLKGWAKSPWYDPTANDYRLTTDWRPSHQTGYNAVFVRDHRVAIQRVFFSSLIGPAGGSKYRGDCRVYKGAANGRIM
jgi:hypothetical protein